MLIPHNFIPDFTLLILFILSSTLIYSQSEGLKLENLDNGKIKILVAEDGDKFRFEYKNDENTTFTIRGENAKIQENKIVLDVKSKVLTINENNDVFKKNSIVYCAGRKKAFSLDNLETVGYYSAEANNRKKAGILLTAAGLLTSLVIAPLVSTDFSEKSLNKSTYRAVGAAGLGGVIIGIPLAASSSEKTYDVSDSRDDNWHILK